MPAMQRGGKQIGNFICTHNDGDGTVAKRAEEGASAYEVSDLFPDALHGRHVMLTVLR